MNVLTNESQDPVAVLDHVLSEVKRYLKDGGEVLGEEEVLSELRVLCEDSRVPVPTRLQFFAVAQKVSGNTITGGRINLLY